MNTHQRWISQLPLLQRRRRKEQRRGTATKGILVKKSHPTKRGPSGSESTLDTEATPRSNSSLTNSPGLPSCLNGESTSVERRSPTDGHDRGVVSDGKDDGVSFSGVEAQKSTRSSRTETTVRRSRRTRIVDDRTLDARLPTAQERSLQRAVEELFDDFCTWCMKLRSAYAVYLPTRSLKSNCTLSLHPAFVGIVLGCFLLAFRDVTVLTLCLIATSRVLRVVRMWASYFSENRVHRDAVKSMRGMVRRFLRESERAISGDYSRQVLAGYLLYNCTAPGESYIASCIRYRMSVINRSVIQEMEERQLKRLGYQKSERDLFQ
jgi:hypothetical protein